VLFPNIVIGTAQFGLDYGIANQSGKMQLSEAESILNFAKRNGIRSIDTAISYGETESILGSIGISEFDIFTKLPEVPLNNSEVAPWIESEIQKSLARLKISQLQGVLLHRPRQLEGKNGPEIFRFLSHLKDSKVIRRIGVSIYAPIELVSVLNKFEIDFVQAPLSLVDNRIEQDGWVEKLNNLGIEVHARSIFLQGLLLMKKNQIPAKFKPWESIFSQWDKWLCHNPEISAVRACLNYVCSKANIDKVIIGIDNLKQLEELVEIIKEPIDIVYPNIFSNDEKLLHPSNWKYL